MQRGKNITFSKCNGMLLQCSFNYVVDCRPKSMKSLSLKEMNL